MPTNDCSDSVLCRVWGKLFSHKLTLFMVGGVEDRLRGREGGGREGGREEGGREG